MYINLIRTIMEGDALVRLKEIGTDSMDIITTDPPYGYSFMNKDWDKAVISVSIWKECLRVLKPGAWAYIMCAPRQDVLSRMIVNLSDAGFKTDFTSMYWAYANGFPKAADISKLVDKRCKKRKEYDELGIFLKNTRTKLGKTIKDISKFFPSKTGGLTGCISNWEIAYAVPTKQQWIILKRELQLDDTFDWLIEQETKRYEEAQREVIGQKQTGDPTNWYSNQDTKKRDGLVDITISKTELAKKLDGSYAGFQPKPAVEVILVCMKPLSEKSYVEQAMKNGKGITWFDDCRIPFNSPPKSVKRHFSQRVTKITNDQTPEYNPNSQGRFPANIICSDDALNDGKITKSRKLSKGCIRNPETTTKLYGEGFGKNGIQLDSIDNYPDSGSFSRYFDVDMWAAQFIITPKPSKSEKNKGLDNFTEEQVNDGRNIPPDSAFQRGIAKRKNTHPTVKPVTLFKYLITMGSREGDIVLDPFMGSGTTAIAAEQTARRWIGIEKNPEYIKISNARLDQYIKQTKFT